MTVDLPEEGSPRIITCLDGMEREDETESKIEDQRSCGGSSGDPGRDPSILLDTKAAISGKRKRDLGSRGKCRG